MAGDNKKEHRGIEEQLAERRDLQLLRHEPEDPKAKADRLAKLAVATGISEAKYQRSVADEKAGILEQVRKAIHEASETNDVMEA